MEQLTKDLKGNWKKLYYRACPNNDKTFTNFDTLSQSWSDEAWNRFEFAALKTKVEFESSQKVKWVMSAKTMFKNYCVMKVMNFVTAALGAKPQTSRFMALSVLQRDAQLNAGAMSIWNEWTKSGDKALASVETAAVAAVTDSVEAAAVS